MVSDHKTIKFENNAKINRKLQFKIIYKLFK